jgi:hypothetical protein
VSNIPIGDLVPVEFPTGESSPANNNEQLFQRSQFTAEIHLPGTVSDSDFPTGGTLDIDVNQITMGSSTQLRNSHNSSRTDTEMPDANIQHEGPAASNKKRRTQFSYSRKFFFASSNIYLQLNPNIPPPASTPQLIGMVLDCPRTSNGQHYRIE